MFRRLRPGPTRQHLFILLVILAFSVVPGTIPVVAAGSPERPTKYWPPHYTASYPAYATVYNYDDQRNIYIQGSAEGALKEAQSTLQLDPTTLRQEQGGNISSILPQDREKVISRRGGVADETSLTGTDFVRATGNHLILGKSGTPFYLKGINYFPAAHPWAIWTAWEPLAVAHELDLAAALGVNSIRTFITYNDFGGPANNWRYQQPLDQFLSLCRQRGIRVELSLFDGYRKYPLPGWDTWPVAGTAAETLDKNYLAAIVLPRSADPTLFAWDLFNEPDWVSPDEWQWHSHAEQRLDWLARMKGEIRRYDQQHPVTVGVIFPELNWIGTAQGQPLLDIVDFVSFHYYRRNYVDRTVGQAIDSLTAHTTKPIVVEEAGHYTDNSPGYSETDQANFLTGLSSDIQSRGTAGFLFWTLTDFPNRGSEGAYGLLRADYTPKAAAAIFQAIQLQMFH